MDIWHHLKKRFICLLEKVLTALHRVFWQQNWSTTDKSCPNNPFVRVGTAACSEKQHCGALLKNLHQKALRQRRLLRNQIPWSFLTNHNSVQLPHLQNSSFSHIKSFLYTWEKGLPTPLPQTAFWNSCFSLSWIKFQRPRVSLKGQLLRQLFW